MTAFDRRTIQHWYSSQRWRDKSKIQLREHPLCVMCLKDSVVTAANVADHVEPHRGDFNKFWDGDLQSLCWHHHNSVKKVEEIRGFNKNIGVDGYPTDKRHPFWGNKN